MNSGYQDAPSTRLIHYWAHEIRGGEHVVKNLASTFPLNGIHFLFGKRSCAGTIAGKIPTHFSIFNTLPGIGRFYRNLLPIYPIICASMRIPKTDIVISSESGPAKAVANSAGGFHVCYCHTPMRYIWSHAQAYLNALSPFQRLVFRLCLPYLRAWDRGSAAGVDLFVANSNTVKHRIEKYYKCDAVVVNPPVRHELFFVGGKKSDYYFILSALVPYKRIDLAVRAFNKLGRKLIIAGGGPQFEELKRIAENNIVFLGRIDDSLVAQYYSQAKAFVFPGEEDFGITPLEAQASGTPVIAYRKGGVTETVKEGQTGIFFDQQRVSDIVDAVLRFEKTGVAFAPKEIRKSVEVYGEDHFRERIRSLVLQSYEKWLSAKGRVKQ